MVFEKKLNLGALLAEVEGDVKEGRIRPARDFLKELRVRI